MESYQGCLIFSLLDANACKGNNPYLVTGIEKRGRAGVGYVRRTYFAASITEAKELAEKDGITVLYVIDLLGVDSDSSS